MFFWCASFTISAPGSATPGQPASDNKPIVLPSKQGLIKLGKSSGCVCLFNSKSVKLGWDFSGEILLINFLAALEFSTIKVSKLSIIVFTWDGKTSKGLVSPKVFGINFKYLQ